MPADENTATEAGADTTPEPNPENGSEHTAERDAGAEKRADPVWRIGRSGRLERVGRREPAAANDDDVMALVNAVTPHRPEPGGEPRTGAGAAAGNASPAAEATEPADATPGAGGAAAEAGGPVGGTADGTAEAVVGGSPGAGAPETAEDTGTADHVARAEGGSDRGGAGASGRDAGNGPGPGGYAADGGPPAAVPPGAGGASGGASGGGTGGGAGPGGSPAAPGQGGGGGRGRRRLRRIAVWTAAGLAVLLTVGIATAYGYYHSLRSGTVQHDLEAALDEAERPEKISDAVNILFMGSDGYEEGSTAYTTEFEGERSDSIMLAHISPEDRVSVISFPRDSLVNLPQCDPYGTAEGTYGYFGMINAAMYHGGPPCVVRTIESLTGIRIDHFVHLSFMSFRDVVDAIGGVDICIPEPMKDERSKLDIPAGQQTLTGDQALSFVRARYEIGDGGDIGRIDRQQMFMAALAGQAMQREVLASPSRMHGILTAVAEHSATDSRLTLDRMLSIAVSLSDVDLSDIEFHTVPWYQAPFDPNRILWYEERAEELFAAVREDRPLPPLMAADEAAVPLDPPGASPSPFDVPGDAPSPSPDAPAARPGEGRDATSNPCADGLGFGTGEEAY
ncbi:Polyisoprenyl-teichoic acid--peptidoglycan teichoic acid transferase TagU [Nocardiopsis dassonvillei]|uniref:LCP family protein n=1 Tax=Nocardiopsis dassonvillei TaxID=2014 RepID=UPI003F54F280